MTTKFDQAINIALFLIVCCLYFVIFSYLSVKTEVLFLPVGEGDSELIKTKAGNLLIDAGPKNYVLNSLSAALPFYDKVLDVVIISHPDADHFNGLLYLLDYYKIRVVVLNNFGSQNGSYLELLRLIHNKNIPIVLGVKGTEIQLGNQKERCKIIYPESSDLATIKNNNDFSIINTFETPYGNFLFTGDAAAKSLEKILKEISDKKFIALKVPHHGAKKTLSRNIITNLHWDYSIIEVGKNSYNHPTQEILSLLQEADIPILRTDLDGLIKFQESRGDFILRKLQHPLFK